MEDKDMFDRTRYWFKRTNQMILTLPVWLVLGLSGFLRDSKTHKGWLKSEKEDSYEKMH